MELDPLASMLALDQEWMRQLQKFNKAQITISNRSNTNQTVRLWGANQRLNFSAPQSFFSTGTYPQAVGFNATLQKVVVANQLSGTVEFFEADGNRISTVQLEPAFPGFASPVALAFNSNVGTTFVAGSISNVIYSISPNYQLQSTVTVGHRPIALAYNSVNGLLYVAHSIGSAITVIDPLANQIVAQITVGNKPSFVEVNDQTGDWFVVNSEDNSVSIFDVNNVLLGSLPQVGSKPIMAQYDNIGNRLLVIAEQSNELLEIDVSARSITLTVPLPGSPRSLHLLPSGETLIAESDSNLLLVLSDSFSPISSIAVNVVNRGIAIDPQGELVYLTNPLSNQVQIATLEPSASSAIEMSEDYAEIALDFQYNPALLKHVKAFFSGSDYHPIIRIGSRTPAGRDNNWALSLGNHQSPEKRLRIAELFELENEVIDGRTYWDFWLLPNQRITLMLYYDQHKRERELSNLKKELWDEKRESDERVDRVNQVRTREPKGKIRWNNWTSDRW